MPGLFPVFKSVTQLNPVVVVVIIAVVVVALLVVTDHTIISCHQ